MSEEQANYITEAREALDMLGKGYGNAAEIHPPKTINVLRDSGLEAYTVWGWVKVSAKFIYHIKKLKGAKLAIWQVIALSINEDGVCDLTIKELKEITEYSHTEIISSLKELDEMGYLSVDRSGKKNMYKPEFAARAGNSPTEQVNDGLVKKVDSTPVYQNESTPSLEKPHSSIKELKELKELTPEEVKQANAMFDAILAYSKQPNWEGRETFRPDHHPLVDWYHNTTGQVCKKSKRNDWHRAVNDWTANNLTAEDLQAAYNEDIGWRHAYTSPNQLTDKAIALKAQKAAQSKPSAPIAPIPERKPNPRPANVPAPKIQRSSHGNS